MKFKVPFSVSSLDRLKKRTTFFKKFIRPKIRSKLGDYLIRSDVTVTREEYLAVCLQGFVFSFLLLFIVSSSILIFIGISQALLYSMVLSLVFAFFVYFSRSVYPRVYATKKQRDIERNIIPALQDMLVQLTSGIPLFTILVNISSSDYGALSLEFRKMVRKINAGVPQTEVLEEVAQRNPSLFFRRTLWQISNGMRAGSDISIIIKDSIKSLSEEQLIQIQTYGNKLNPSIMFYMLSSVILPALSITFLTIISSLINLSANITKAAFIILFVSVVLIQIVFLGVIKTIRPSLL
jgi:pilus assembly protein TadC